jgi:adenylate cyclase
VLKRLTLILGLSITALAVLLAAAGPPVLSQARDLVFDAYQRASPRAFDPDAPVHIVDIDEAALDAYGQWPWPRSYLAALTDRLFDHGAAAVGYDVLFAEPDRTSPERIAESWSRFRDGIPPVLPDLGLPPHDQVFAAAIAGRPVVLSVAGGQEGEVPCRWPVWPSRARCRRA